MKRLGLNVRRYNCRLRPISIFADLSTVHVPCGSSSKTHWVVRAQEVEDSIKLRQPPEDVASYKGETCTKLNTMLCIRSWSLAESIVHKSCSCTTLFRQVHKPQGKVVISLICIYCGEPFYIFFQVSTSWLTYLGALCPGDRKLWQIFHDVPGEILDEEQTSKETSN